MPIGVITVRLIPKRSFTEGRTYGKTYHYIFMLKSADGKIITGSIEEIGLDWGFTDNPDIVEELHQYYLSQQKKEIQMKISEIFELKKSQHELDFVDVDIDSDTPLFLDPYFIAKKAIRGRFLD